MENNFTEEEIMTAKKVKAMLINGEMTQELTAIYMAGEICMWDELRDEREGDIAGKAIIKQITEILGVVNFSSHNQMRQAIEGAIELAETHLATPPLPSPPIDSLNS